MSVRLSRRHGIALVVSIVVAGLGLAPSPASAATWAGVGDVYAQDGSSAPRCLEVPGNRVHQRGVALQAWNCISGVPANQRWEWSEVHIRGRQYFMLRNTASKMCMSVAGGSQQVRAPIVQWPCNANDHSMVWGKARTRPPWPQPVEMINYRSGKCLSLAGQSKANGAKYILWNCVNTWNNRFYLSGG